MKAHIHFHSSKQQDMSTLTGRLRRQSRNITGPRQAILEILRKHPHPLTTKEIRAAMPADQCDLATIYRATHLLEQMGMLKRFDFGDGAARFELIGEGDDAGVARHHTANVGSNPLVGTGLQSSTHWLCAATQQRGQGLSFEQP